MSTEMARDQGLEKQMGCMSGFFQLFDRNQGLSGKRLYSAKRLPPPVGDGSSESENSSPVFSGPKKQYQSPEKTPEPPPKSPLPLLFEIKEGSRSSWKFSKETPRLSLDSRAITDAKGGLHPREIRTGSSITGTGDGGSGNPADDSQQYRSPSVIARLMGLEPLSDSPSSEPTKTPELRRSSSESRVSRDLFRSRFIADAAANLFSKQPPSQSVSASTLESNGGIGKEKPPLFVGHCTDPWKYFVKNNSTRDSEQKQSSNGSFGSLLPRKPPPPRKSFYDSGDFFPEPRQILSFHGGTEKIKGIDEPSNDLETLKQILEALQLKGLLRSKKSPELSKFSHQNFVYDDSPHTIPIPSRPPYPAVINRRHDAPSNVHRRNYKAPGEISPSASPRRERSSPMRVPGRYSRSPSPTRDGNTIGRKPNSLTKPATLSVITQTSDSRRTSPIHSPKLNPRRASPVSTTAHNPPLRVKTSFQQHQKERNNNMAIPVTTEDESSSISGSSITTTTTTTDTEAQRSKSDEHREELKEGKNLLERCDKLLNSIAEITATEQQPSPVSVLDSTFYKDESSTPSPVITRRNIDFKDGDSEDEIWTTPAAGDGDFLYISDVIRACRYLPRDSDIFLTLEKQSYRKEETSNPRVSMLQRLLIFDTVNEILDRKRRMPPWRAVRRPSVGDVWSEYVRLRGVETGEKDLFQRISDVMKKDLCDDGALGWGEWPMEMGEGVLDIERLVFKDLIGDIIRDFATSASPMIRRKLIF